LTTPRVLLCDADGTLFPSEEPAFEASAAVTNRLLAEIGAPERYTATQLRQATSGRNFRSTAPELARAAGLEIPAGVLEEWVEEERRAVSAHLAEALAPDPAVAEPLARLAQRFELAVVTSSASSRVQVCLQATGLDALFSPERLFSAETSLPRPQSKPSPAIYRLAGERLGVAGARALAVEDTATGVESAVAAGFPVVGCVMFVPPEERSGRVTALREAGAGEIISSWSELEQILPGAPAAAPA
jgi:HAD superfamily hydrolase (TIGR01509 family)